MAFQIDEWLTPDFGMKFKKIPGKHVFHCPYIHRMWHSEFLRAGEDKYFQQYRTYRNNRFYIENVCKEPVELSKGYCWD